MCCIWWLLFGFFLGLLLYWLLDKFLLRGDNDENKQISADKDRKIDRLQQEISALHAQIDADKQSREAAGTYGFSLQKNGRDNLQLIEGIGPKIESLLHEANITTFAELHATSTEKLQDILQKAGARFKLAKPETWPEQAEYCVNQDWKGLKDYQDYLRGGVDLSPRDPS